MSWKAEIAEKYKGDYESIGRVLARSYDIPWSTMWDFKQILLAQNTVPVASGPKILFFDIETAPILAHVWSMWPNYVSLNQIQEDWYMLSWSAKWLGGETIYHDNLARHEETFAADAIDDEVIIRSLYDMIEEADIIIGHNVKKFDNKKFKARCLKHDLKPMSSYVMIDTLTIAKQEFALTSNKLDWLATYLGFENKVSHEGHTLWTKCMSGDMDAWATMEEYNDYDVVLLEDVYMKIRHWYRLHPNVAVYYEDFEVRCTTCGSTDLVETDTFKYTNLSKFNEVSCNDCGKVSRRAKNLLPKEKKASMLRNI